MRYLAAVLAAAAVYGVVAAGPDVPDPTTPDHGSTSQNR